MDLLLVYQVIMVLVVVAVLVLLAVMEFLEVQVLEVLVVMELRQQFLEPLQLMPEVVVAVLRQELVGQEERGAEVLEVRQQVALQLQTPEAVEVGAVIITQVAAQAAQAS